MMETVNDFGTVDYFAVQTLTTGIFSVWLQSGNAGGAAQLACVILAVIIVLVSLEKSARRRMKFFNLSTRHRGGKSATDRTAWCDCIYHMRAARGDWIRHSYIRFGMACVEPFDE